MKMYKNDDITVYWFPELCSHPGICLRLLPKVFDADRRPWVDVNAASPEEIIRCIDKCPSGALRYSLPEGSSVDPRTAQGTGNVDYEKTNPPAVRIRSGGKGPILVEGPAEVVGAGGKRLRAGGKMVLCGCGKSQNCPFCDGSHIGKKCP